MRNIRLCKICKKEFDSYNNIQRYCSKECKSIGVEEINKKYQQKQKKIKCSTDFLLKEYGDIE